MSYATTYSGDFVDPTLRSHDRYLYHRYLGPLPEPYYSTREVKSDTFSPASHSPSFRLPPLQNKQHYEGKENPESERKSDLFRGNTPPPHSYLHMRGAGYQPHRQPVLQQFSSPPEAEGQIRDVIDQLPPKQNEDEPTAKPNGKDKENINTDKNPQHNEQLKKPYNAMVRERSYDVITGEPSLYISNNQDAVRLKSVETRRGKKMYDHLNQDPTSERIFPPDGKPINRLVSPSKGARTDRAGKPPLPVVNRKQLQPQLVKSEQLFSQRLPSPNVKIPQASPGFQSPRQRQRNNPPLDPLNNNKLTRLKYERMTRSYPSTPLRIMENEKDVRSKLQNNEFFRSRPGSLPRMAPPHDMAFPPRGMQMTQREQNQDKISNFEEASERISEYAEREDLKIVVLDLLEIENAFDHHTFKFDAVRSGNLVVRRGQSFDILLKFNRDYNLKRDSLRFIFETGPDPSPVRGTSVECMLGSKDNLHGWRAMIKKRLAKDEIMLFVYSSPDCVVSNWKMYIETVEMFEDRVKPVALSKEISIFILFNPWCKDDCVYFPDNRLLEEYVNNDSGIIFQGNYKQIGGKPWFFGQFEEGVLEASLYCMQKGFNFQFDLSMGDPVRVSRAIARIVNSQDDRGVLVGNWTNNYSNGVSPLKWSGSVAILREYMETNQPVKFGQCFVFSGIVTTVCRAIGIPCRSVTNFASAHDTDGSTTIDVYWDLEKGERISHGESRDSIWNFHVWNDVWMRRRDLPPGFSGWQAIDATPQERSNGKMQCGPASLHGIKEGLLEHSFDGPFVFAEVNGDKINWAKQNDGRRYVLSVESSAIGKKVSTKIPDGKPIPANLTNVERVRQDITNQYKYEEESDRERIAVMAAQRRAHGRKPYYNTGRQDIEFDGFERMDYILIGSDFEIGGFIRNSSNEMRSVEARFVCESVSYKGHRLSTIKQQTFSGVLQPRHANKATMFVKYEDYAFKVNEQGCMKVSLMIRVLETGQRQTWQDDFRLRRPDLTVEVPEIKGRVLQPMECKVSFRNPLPNVALTNCTVTLEGSGFTEAEKHMSVVDIPPYDRWSAVLTLTPTKPGRRQFFVTFNSDIIQDISGVAEVDIE